jgi:hypothetical protein
MITISQFRADKDLVKFAQEIFSDRTFQLMLEACERAHPVRNAPTSDNNNDVSPTSAAIELGIQKGYQVFEDNLRLLATSLPDDSGLSETQYLEEPIARPSFLSEPAKKKPKKK